MKNNNIDFTLYKNLLSRVRVPHPSYNMGLAELKRSYDSVGTTDFPQCLHIVGASRAGKTCLINEFRKLYPSYRAQDGVQIRIVYAEIPPTGTIMGVMENILYALGDPVWSKGTASNKLARVIDQLEKCGCRMLVLDELQHLVDKGQNRMLKQTRDWIKALANANRWAVVVCGLETSRAVITQDAQLKARFDAEIRLPRFDWDDDALYTQFLGVLGGFQEGLAPFSLPDMQDETVALRFYLASGGLIGYVVKLLNRAIQDAIADKRTAIGLPELEKAFRRAISFASDIPAEEGPFVSKLIGTPPEEHRARCVKLATAEDDVKEKVPKALVTSTLPSKKKTCVPKKEHRRQMGGAFA
ncbi:MAG: TniB family NTP-binding protein [Arenimonas sp.]